MFLWISILFYFIMTRWWFRLPKRFAQIYRHESTESQSGLLCESGLHRRRESLMLILSNKYQFSIYIEMRRKMRWVLCRVDYEPMFVAEFWLSWLDLARSWAEHSWHTLARDFVIKSKCSPSMRCKLFWLFSKVIGVNLSLIKVDSSIIQFIEIQNRCWTQSRVDA